MRKAQAATEFLSTYGIAIIAVLVVTGILAYFGYLSPVQYTPRNCDLGSQIKCYDYILTASKLKITVANTFQADINVINLSSQAYLLSGCTLPKIPAGQRAEIACDVVTSSGTNTEMDLALTYKRAGGTPHTIRGMLRATSVADDSQAASCLDSDSDSYTAKSCGGNDCNDNIATIHPGAPDYCSGNIDEDCDLDNTATEPGCVACDNDGDGDSARTCLGSDCRDDNPRIWFNNPNGFCDCKTTDNGIAQGTIETADGIDNNCNGIIDEGTAPLETVCNNLIDDDGDGCVDAIDSDCGGVEMCTNARDEDCDTFVNCEDSDCTTTPTQLANCLYCEDEIKSGQESDVDCGKICEGCSDGKSCTGNADCKSNACEGLRCVSCTDNLQNQDETDIDCGGTICSARCGNYGLCTLDSDCLAPRTCCPPDTNGETHCAVIIKKGKPPVCV